MHGEQAAGFSIIPLTVHRNSVTRPATTATIATSTVTNVANTDKTRWAGTFGPY